MSKITYAELRLLLILLQKLEAEERHYQWIPNDPDEKHREEIRFKIANEIHPVASLVGRILNDRIEEKAFAKSNL